MTNPILNHLAEAGAIIISTWDIVITPYVALKLQAHETPQAKQQRETSGGPLQIIGGPGYTTFAFGSIALLKTTLTPKREHLLPAKVFEAVTDHWDWPAPLVLATDGFLEQDAYSPQNVWRLTSVLDGSEWSTAERLRCSLRQVKQARKVRKLLDGSNTALPESWSDALEKAVELAPEKAGLELVRAYNRL